MLGLGLNIKKRVNGGAVAVVIPVLSTAITADGVNIVLTYDIALDETSVPATTDFSASGGRTVTNVAVSGSTVTVTVSLKYSSADTVTLSYTAGINKILSNSGGVAANLVTQAVTNNTPFGPDSISGLEVWLEGGSGITLSGSQVTLWADQSGNGHDVSSDVAAPISAFGTVTYNATDSEINNKPSLVFDGASVLRASVASFSLAQPQTVFVVGKSTVVGKTFLDAGSGAGLAQIGSTTTTWRVRQDVIYNVGTINSVYNIFSVTFNGAATNFRRNGSDIGTGNAGTAIREGITVGGNTSTAGMTGNIAEVIIYSGALSAPDIALIEGYLNSKYTIY